MRQLRTPCGQHQLLRLTHTMLFAALLPTWLPAQALHRQSATVPQSSWFDVGAKATGRSYRIFLSLPTTAAPEEGFPVVYLLDASWYFSTAAEIKWLNTAMGQLPAAVLVGIGYADPAAARRLRFTDFTPPLPAGQPTPPMVASLGATVGEADAFLQFVTEELTPMIAGLVPTNASCQGLIGHSLGGLLAVQAMRRVPDRFTAYAIGDPSLWWGSGVVVADATSFIDHLARTSRPRVLLALSSTATAPSNVTALEFGRLLRERLGDRVVLHQYDQETHNSMVPAFLDRALRHILSCPKATAS